MLLEDLFYFLFLFIDLGSLQIFSTWTFVSLNAMSRCVRSGLGCSGAKSVSWLLGLVVSSVYVCVAGAFTAYQAASHCRLVTAFDKPSMGVSDAWDSCVLLEASLAPAGCLGCHWRVPPAPLPKAGSPAPGSDRSLRPPSQGALHSSVPRVPVH